MAASDLASANAMFGEYADAIPAAAEVAVSAATAAKEAQCGGRNGAALEEETA